MIHYYVHHNNSNDKREIRFWTCKIHPHNLPLWLNYRVDFVNILEKTDVIIPGPALLFLYADYSHLEQVGLCSITDTAGALALSDQL